MLFVSPCQGILRGEKGRQGWGTAGKPPQEEQGPPKPTHTHPPSGTGGRAGLSCVSHSQAGRGEPTPLLQRRLLETLAEEELSPFYTALTGGNRPRFRFPRAGGTGPAPGLRYEELSWAKCPPPIHPSPPTSRLSASQSCCDCTRVPGEGNAFSEAPTAPPLPPPRAPGEQQETPPNPCGATHILTGLSAASATAESRWTLQARPCTWRNWAGSFFWEEQKSPGLAGGRGKRIKTPRVRKEGAGAPRFGEKGKP